MPAGMGKASRSMLAKQVNKLLKAKAKVLPKGRPSGKGGIQGSTKPPPDDTDTIAMTHPALQGGALNSSIWNQYNDQLYLMMRLPTFAGFETTPPCGISADADEDSGSQACFNNKEAMTALGRKKRYSAGGSLAWLRLKSVRCLHGCLYLW